MNAVLTHKDLQAHAWSLDQCMLMLQEARDGEDKLQNTVSQSDFRRALGLEIKETQQKSKKKNSKKKTKKTVGKPLPQRRPVGESENVG